MKAAGLIQHGPVGEHGRDTLLEAALLESCGLQRAVGRDYIGHARVAGRGGGRPIGKLPDAVDVHDIVLRRELLDSAMQLAAVPDRVAETRREFQDANAMRCRIVDRLG